MKNYVVGILDLSAYDLGLELFKVEAENEYDALKKGMLEFTPDEYK